MAGDFFDTNVLIYLVSGDATKADSAEQLVAGGGSISVQVLNEIAHVARRKLHMSWEETHTLLGTLRAVLEVHPLTLATHERGLALAERYGLALYDAMIAAAAVEAGCEVLWSEDMQHGQCLGATLRVANPFR